MESKMSAIKEFMNFFEHRAKTMDMIDVGDESEHVKIHIPADNSYPPSLGSDEYNWSGFKMKINKAPTIDHFHRLPGASFSPESKEYCGQFEKCLKESPVGQAPEWAVGHPGSRHEGNHLIFTTEKPPIVKPVKWMDTNVGFFPDEKTTVVGCVDRNKVFYRINFLKNWNELPNQDPERKQVIQTRNIEYKSFQQKLQDLWIKTLA